MSSVRLTLSMPELQRAFNPATAVDLQTCCMMAGSRLGLKNKSSGSCGGIIFNSQTAPKSSRAITSLILSLPGEGTAPYSFQGGAFDLIVPVGFSARHELIPQAITSPPYSSYLAELSRPTSLVSRAETHLPVRKFPRIGRDSSPHGRALSCWSCPFCYHVPLQLRSDGSFQQQPHVGKHKKS
jgi:hypothetical protein